MAKKADDKDVQSILGNVVGQATTTMPNKMMTPEGPQDISEWYNSEDPSATAFRAKYDIATDAEGKSTFVKKSANASQSPAPDTVDGGFDSMITDLEKRRDDYRNQSRKEINQAEVSKTFAGATEAAAALVNLFGVSKGARPMTWNSPRREMKGRVDLLKKEREQRLDKYQQMIASIKKQRADYDLSQRRLNKQRDEIQGLNERAAINARSRENVADINAKAKEAAAGISADAQIRKAEIANQSKLANIDAAQRKTLMSQATNMVNKQIHEYSTNTGHSPSQDVIDYMYTKAIERVQAAQTSLLPPPSNQTK